MACGSGTGGHAYWDGCEPNARNDFKNGAASSASIPDHGTAFEGTDGWVHVYRGGLVTRPEKLAEETLGPTDKPLPVSSSHQRNFIESVRSRKPAICPIEDAVIADTLCHLSDIATRVNRKLTWDPKQEQFVERRRSQPEAQAASHARAVDAGVSLGSAAMALVRTRSTASQYFPRAILLSMNRPPDEHRTPNIEHRTSKGACASRWVFGVRCWMFGVRPPSGSWPRFTSEFWRCSLPMNQTPRRTPNAQHRTPNIEGRLREPLGVRRSVLDVRCSSPVRFMASIHVRIFEVFPTPERSKEHTRTFGFPRSRCRAGDRVQGKSRTRWNASLPKLTARTR